MVAKGTALSFFLETLHSSLQPSGQSESCGIAAIFRAAVRDFPQRPTNNGKLFAMKRGDFRQSRRRLRTGAWYIGCSLQQGVDCNYERGGMPLCGSELVSFLS
jgi:hypothetical protein